MNLKKAFTLSETMVTMTLIGVVAAVTIPAVVVNHNNMANKIGLKKAVTTLENALSLGVATGRGSVLKSESLYAYLSEDMSLIKKTNNMEYVKDGKTVSANRGAFYTIDGMRFEIPNNDSEANKMAKSDNGQITLRTVDTSRNSTIGYCGTQNTTLNSSSPESASHLPCPIIVDVNGDKGTKPMDSYNLKLGGTRDKTIGDVFLLLVTDAGVIPYGELAQKALYE